MGKERVRGEPRKALSTDAAASKRTEHDGPCADVPTDHINGVIHSRGKKGIFIVLGISSRSLASVPTPRG